MSSLNNINTAITGIQAGKTVKELQEQRPLLERLLWEQQQTNRLLWAMLAPEQRASLIAENEAITAAEAAAAAEEEEGKRRKGRWRG